MKAAPDRPLSGVTVVDLLWGPLAPASRYLAELGASVHRIAQPPAAVDALADRVANLGKRLYDIPVASAQAQALLASADILFSDQPIDADGLLAAHPAKVIVEVSNFGRGNRYSGWAASDAVLHALSGELSRSGIRGREPLLPPGQLAFQCAAAQAAFVGLQSYYLALKSGRGGLVDFSALDGAVQALDPGFGIGGSATLGRPAHLLSRDRPPKGFQYPILRCADGHVRLCLLAARQWQGMFRWMGEPEAFADPAFNQTTFRYRSPDLLPAIGAFFADKTRAELEAAAAEHGVPLSGLATLAEPPRTPHFVERKAFRTEQVEGKPFQLANGCISIDGERMTPDLSPEAAGAIPGKAELERPFSGIKVLDLGVIVVGAETGRLLADQGADVVKLESRNFPDGNRQSYLTYGLSVSFAAGHRNKRGLGLDLRDPRGKALFLRLVGEADVVLSNFKPGTLDALGLGYEVLAKANPRIVCVESSAFGDKGEWSHRMGYGPLARAATGVTGEWRYANDAESYSDSITIYPDHVAARLGAIATVALLVRRERTGKGGQATLAQAEVVLAQFALEIACLEAGKPVPQADSRVYRCAGEDEWCVVTIANARDAQAISALTAGLALEGWLMEADADSAMQRLQLAGVPAARMLRVGDLPDFPYYQERGLFRTEQHPLLVEDVIAEARQALGGSLLPPPGFPAPLMGEHSTEVVRDWLGLEETEISALVDAKVLQRTSAEEMARVIETLAKAAEQVRILSS